MINLKFKSHGQIFYAIAISIIVNIFIGLIGFYLKWKSLPSFSDIIIALTLMAPFSKPIAFGELLKLLDPFSQGYRWHVAFLLYWPTIIGLLIKSYRTKSVWPFGISAFIGALGSPLWFVIGIGLLYI